MSEGSTGSVPVLDDVLVEGGKASTTRAYPPRVTDLNKAAPASPDSVRPEVVVELPGFKVLHLALVGGRWMPEHDHADCDVTIQCLYGTVSVRLDGATVRLAPGQLLSFAGESRVSPGNDGPADCGMLITLASR